jgi:hypothetical protein
MTRNIDNENQIDPKLIEKIELMGPTPDRDPLLASKGREKFISELEGIPGVVPKSSLAWLTGLFKSGDPKPGEAKNRKFAVSTLVALIFVIVVLFGGASATAYASQTALPGDALYPVKTSIESTQISLANDAYLQAQLYLEFAQRRMEEITKLLQQGRTTDIEFAASEFEVYLQKAMEATQVVLASDPERGAELSRLVSQALLDYAVALKSVLVSAPEVIKPAVEKALLISHDGAGDEIEIVGIVVAISDTQLEIDGEIYLINELTEIEDLIKVGDSVKVHVIHTADGLMIVREIELTSEFEDSFSDNSNNNVNENEDIFDNENENFNDNDSGDNENENISDDNQNDNESEDDDNDNEFEDNDNESEEVENDNESDDDDKDSESDDNGNDNEAEDNLNDNQSENTGSDDRSDNSNENDHSEDNENESESSDSSGEEDEKEDD